MKKRKQTLGVKLTDFFPEHRPDKTSPYGEDILVEKYEAEIDERLEDLQESLGREITDTERRGLLKVVDKYTPKDKGGNILGNYLPFDYAWEIYELERNARFEENLNDWYKNQKK